MFNTEKIVVVTPTYNERENIGTLIEQVFKLGIPNLEMFVVDDNSPDGTAAVVEELSHHYAVRLLRRSTKMGLGSAYRDAFLHVLEDPDVAFVLQMDADLSHDPRAIPQFLAAIRNADLVLGSRYMLGGRVENWATTRRLISRFGCWYSRIMLGLPHSDLTGGYKCWRREVLERIPFDSISSIGYNFQVETTWWAYKMKSRISEIPIVFSERTIGKSKFNVRIMCESFFKVLALRIRKQQ